MRITNNMLTNSTLRNLNSIVERLDRLQAQLTSGQRIIMPSDDPIGAAAAVELRSTIDELDQFVRNADSANSWLEATDSALESVGRVLQRARELAVQGANDTLSGTDRQVMANEIGNLLDQAIALGNSTFGGQYLFSGFKITTAPFSAVGIPPTAVTYNGDTGQMVRQLDSQSTVAVNVQGNTTLGTVFTSLIGLRDDLISDNGPAVATRIAELDSAIDSVLSARSQVGARMNRVESQKDRLESLKTNITGLLSKTQDVDMTEAITEFAVQENVYKAALGAAGRSIQPSLLDYLR